MHVRVMIEERGRENELWFAKPSFTARPVRLDPSHFYHPGLATTDESRIGCGGTNERGGRRRRGWPRRARKTERVPLAPLHAALRVSPFLHRTNQPAALSLQLFAGFNHLATRSDARRGLVGFSRNPRLSRLPKAVPNVVARRLACALPPPSLRAHTISVSCRLSLKFTPRNPSSRRPPPPPAADTKDLTIETRVCIDHARKLHRCALSVTSGERGKSLGGCFRGGCSRNFWGRRLHA